jgi:hypothetical protein
MTDGRIYYHEVHEEKNDSYSGFVSFAFVVTLPREYWAEEFGKKTLLTGLGSIA